MHYLPMGYVKSSSFYCQSAFRVKCKKSEGQVKRHGFRNVLAPTMLVASGVAVSPIRCSSTTVTTAIPGWRGFMSLSPDLQMIHSVNVDVSNTTNF